MRRPARDVALPAAGLAVIVVAVSPPVEAAVVRSLTAHMVQHLALLLVAPALLAAGRPVAMVASLSHRAARLLEAASRPLRRPDVAGRAVVAVAFAHAVVVSAWHLPAAYDAAVDAVPLHLLEHVSFLAVGWATWAAIRTAWSQAPASTVAGLFVVAAQGAALGAVLTFAGRPLYGSTAADALADQQLAGLVMWVPGGAPYAAVAAALVVRTLAAARPAEAMAVVRR